MSAASPAKPGDLPYGLVVATYIQIFEDDILSAVAMQASIAT